MDYSKLKVKKKYLNINVGRYTLKSDMPTNEKKFIYMTISKDFFEKEEKIKNKAVEVKLSDAVSKEEKEMIEKLKNDNISKEK